MSPDFRAEIHDGFGAVAEATWDELFKGHPDSFQLVRFIEQTGMDGFVFRSLIVSEGRDPVMLFPLFEVRLEAASLMLRSVRPIARTAALFAPSLLRPRLLGVGLIEAEWGAIGIRPGLGADALELAFECASRALCEHACRQGAHIQLFLDIPLPHAESLPKSLTAGYLPVEGYSYATLNLSAHSVNSYLAARSRSTRQRLRRQVRAAEKEGVRSVRLRDLGGRLPEVYDMYRASVDRAPRSLGWHRKEFFAQVSARVAGAHFLLYLLRGELLAFNLVVESPGRLVDKYFGMHPEEGRRLSMYFVSWMDNVKYCVDHGITTYMAGAGADETKARLGCSLQPGVTIFKHRSPVAQAALSRLRARCLNTTVLLRGQQSPAKSPLWKMGSELSNANLVPVCLDLDGSVVSSPRLCERMKHIADLRAVGQRFRLLTSTREANRLAKRLRQLRLEIPNPWLTFFGSGDFHHATLVLLGLLTEPDIHLVLIDNHPDWCVLPPTYHCGTWLARAARLPHIRRTWLIGMDSPDIHGWRVRLGPLAAISAGHIRVYPLRLTSTFVPLWWRKPGGRPWGSRLLFDPLAKRGVATAFAEVSEQLSGCRVYVSIDKDCLAPQDATTDWDQGGLALPELCEGLARLRSECHLVGADVCGDRAPTALHGIVKRFDAGRLGPHRPTCDADLARNERANLAILDALTRPEPSPVGPSDTRIARPP